MSNYRYYFINAAKIDLSNLSNLGEITSQRYPISRREQVIKFGYLPLKNGFNQKQKMNFMSRTVLSDPFPNEGIFFIFSILDVSMRKEQ